MDIGIIANPASGKDIRRLTAQASVFDNQEKSAIVRRCLAGIQALAPRACIHFFPDTHNIVSAALARAELDSLPLAMELTGTSEDSTQAAKRMPRLDALISLGGDGTNRAIAKAELDVPLIALSTGTNNAFPTLCEATSAGMATALIAARKIPLESIAPKTKAIHLRFASGEEDLALIDVVGTVDRFMGTRALLEPRNWRFAILSVADPSKVGMTAVGGLAHPVTANDEMGLHLVFSGQLSDTTRTAEVLAPVAPGIVKRVQLEEIHHLPCGETIRLRGVTMLAFDGERERIINAQEDIEIWVARDGPRRVDIAACLRYRSRFNEQQQVQVKSYAF